MKYVVPLTAKNPNFKRMWIDPNDPMEIDRFGNVKAPDICTPYITVSKVFDTKEEMETFLKKHEMK